MLGEASPRVRNGPPLTKIVKSCPSAEQATVFGAPSRRLQSRKRRAKRTSTASREKLRPMTHHFRVVGSRSGRLIRADIARLRPQTLVHLSRTGRQEAIALQLYATHQFHRHRDGISTPINLTKPSSQWSLSSRISPISKPCG